ncbi:NAD(P)-binding domain-containing protein [Francisella salimarina]|uniref:NAD(P)-binding domain-containing protein n=1 Tax=Francisella salimarina TaxID=2599927 RepID=UPI003D818EC5
MNRVAIIGAGASGLINAKVLKDGGFQVKVFEKTNNICGVWNYDESEGPLYETLKTNLPKEIMVFENEKIPYNSNKSFIEHKEVLYYLEANAKAWQIDDSLCLNAEVIGLKPIQKLSKRPLWKLSYISNSAVFNEEFDFVIIANGHYDEPKIPNDTNGFDYIVGSASHSKYYRSVDNYAKKVLCVGYSSSGMDISHELCNSGRDVYVSVRELENNQELYNLQNNLNIKFISSIDKYYKCNDKCIATTINGNTIEIDEIIFCTGYKYSFPFLSQDIISTKDNVVSPLYNQILHKDYLNLAFVGIPWKTVPFVLSECQAIFLAKLWQSNQDILSSIVEKMINTHKHSFKFDSRLLKNYHMLGDEQWEYNLSILDVVGEKTHNREERIRLIEQVYNDVHKLKIENPHGYRDIVYNVDFEKGHYNKQIN